LLLGQPPSISAFGQGFGTAVPGQHGEGLSAFSFIMQPVLSVLVFSKTQAPPGAQDLLNGHRPVELPPQGELVPLVSTEWAAKAQAAMITRTNIAVFKLFKPPELEEQHSPPSFFCGIFSFSSIFCPQNKCFFILFQNHIIVIITCLFNTGSSLFWLFLQSRVYAIIIL
jgi:hypothetical protein